MKTYVILFTLLLSSVHITWAQSVSAPTNNAGRIAIYHADQLNLHASDADYLVLPGLLANRATREVQFYAEATGVGANEILEYLIVGQGGGHDYEAFATSFARAGDIHRGLTFIGLPEGRGVNFLELAFWPKGERVIVHVMPVGGYDEASTNAVWAQPVRLEELVWNRQKGGPMQSAGLVFTGSRMISAQEGATNRVYAADVQEPRSIASNYNEPQTVLDVPWQASQDSVYSSQQMRESHVLPKATLLKITMSPERSGGTPRVQDVTLQIDPHGAGARAVSDADFTALDPEGRVLSGPTNLPAVVKAFADIVAGQRDPFVTLKFSDEAPLGLVQPVAGILGTLEGDTGIRIEPALPGQLYYRAFNPPEQNRARETRMRQPWELHIVQGAEGLSGTLIDVKETYADGNANPEFTSVDYKVASSLLLRTQLDIALRSELNACLARLNQGPERDRLKSVLDDLSNEKIWSPEGEAFFSEVQEGLYKQDDYSSLPEKVRRLRVILVYADPAVSHGALMTFLKDAMTSHPTVHVYLTKAE